MRLIVADAYGSGVRVDTDGNTHDLGADDWTEIDVRDHIVAGDGVVVVRYRDDGREVEVPAGSTYQIEYQNDDVIDVRSADTTVDELLRAMDGIGTDEQRIYDVLGAVSGIDTKISALREAFQSRTGRSLDDALRAELSGDELERALDLLR
jgi:Annexin